MKGEGLAGLCILLAALGIAGCGEEKVPVKEEKPEAPVVEEIQQAPPVQITPVEDPRVEQPVAKAPVVDNSYILITKSNFSLHYFDNEGQEKFVASCALGKNPGQKEKSGDMKTPEGTFVIDEVIDSSWWTHDFGDGKGEIAGAYGPYFISLNTDELSQGNWGGIGIHGTHDPASIGTRASEGCIRLLNEDVKKLQLLVHVGMKVIITE